MNDYKKVRDFYVDLLGMKVTEDNGKQCRLVFGNNMLIPRNRAAGGPAKVDHIAYTVTNWDAEKDGLEEELKRRGLQYRGSAKTSFHVKDPEGDGSTVRRIASMIGRQRGCQRRTDRRFASYRACTRRPTR